MSYIHALRQKIGSQKIPLVFCSACIQNEDGKVLMQRRGDFGFWGLPGGVLEIGETLHGCIWREVQEETGLTIQLMRLSGIYSSPDFDVVYPNGDQVQQITFCFVARVQGGNLTEDGDETLELRWFDPTNPPQTSAWYQAMLTDFLREVFAQFAHGSPGKRQANSFLRPVRERVGKETLILPTARAFVQDDQGRVLLHQRGDDRLWSLPGGMLELGERLDTTAVLETFEETGITIQVDQLVGAYTRPEIMILPNGDQVYPVVTLFRGFPVEGSLHADGRETVDAGFWPVEKLPRLSTFQRQLIQNALANKLEAVYE